VTTEPDGTRMPRDADGYMATTHTHGTQTIQQPDGTTTTVRVDAPEAPDSPLEEDEIGNAIAGGLASGFVEGAAEGAANPLWTAAKESVEEGVKDTAKEGLKESFDTGSPEDYPHDDAPAATAPDASADNSHSS
jgi:hypothetical protein